MKKVNFQALLKNEKVMYVVLFVTAMSSFGYLMARNVEAITLMAAVGFLTWNFSKNMTIVLGTALLVTNVVYGVRRFEGFDEGAASNAPVDASISEEPANESPNPKSNSECEPADAECLQRKRQEGLKGLKPASLDESDIITLKEAKKLQKDVDKSIKELNPLIETLKVMLGEQTKLS